MAVKSSGGGRAGRGGGATRPSSVFKNAGVQQARSALYQKVSYLAANRSQRGALRDAVNARRDVARAEGRSMTYAQAESAVLSMLGRFPG